MSTGFADVAELVDLQQLKAELGAGGPGGGSRQPDVRAGGDGGAPSSERLVKFLNALEKLVMAALERPAFFTGHNLELRQAWVDVRPRFDALRDQVQSLGDPDLQRVGPTGAELDLKLAVFEEAARIFLDDLDRLDHGRLRRRLSLAPRFVVPAAREPWGELMAPPLPAEADQERSRLIRRLLKGTKASLETLLGVADKTVQSAGAAIGYANPLAGAIAGAAAEGIDEFKGMMEGILKRRKQKKQPK